MAWWRPKRAGMEMDFILKTCFGDDGVGGWFKMKNGPRGGVSVLSSPSRSPGMPRRDQRGLYESGPQPFLGGERPATVAPMIGKDEPRSLPDLLRGDRRRPK
jgi:hypothetical protein